MKAEVFEVTMRAGEIYHQLRVPAGEWPVIRVDGRGFSSRLAEAEKPFDAQVHEVMVTVARRLMCDLGGLFAYTYSDEISILLPSDYAQFDRGVEKMVSLSAAGATAAWAIASHTQAWGPGGQFDARVWVGFTTDAVIDYFRWRLANCARYAIQGAAFWALRREGHSPRTAARILRGQSIAQMRTWLHSQGAPIEGFPPVLRTGSALVWTWTTKQGYNPQRGEHVWAQRRELVHCAHLPGGMAFSDWLPTVCPALAAWEESSGTPTGT